MNRLFDFFYANEKLRWKVYLSAGWAALTYGLVNLWVFHRSEERVFSETACLLVFLILSMTVLTIVRGVKGKEPVRLNRSPRASAKFIVAGVCAVALLANMFVIDVPAFQASLADFSLRRIAKQLDSVQAASLSPEQLQARFRRIQSVVGNSSEGQIPVDARTLKWTQSAVSHYLLGRSLPERTNQAGWAAAIDLQFLASRRYVETGQVVPQVAKQGYVLNSFLELNHDLYFQGESSAFFVNDAIGIKGAAVTFDRINFNGRWNPLVLMDDRASALVIDSYFQAGTQVLDRITWVNVHFQNTRILYNQGPLRLRNVSFTNCDLRDLQPPFHIEQELLRRIQESNGRPFTYVFEPAAGGSKSEAEKPAGATPE